MTKMEHQPYVSSNLINAKGFTDVTVSFDCKQGGERTLKVLQYLIMVHLYILLMALTLPL
jgi:hypothetical protein